ncbi:MAG: sulfatase [Pyrinomonadaceae bacterium]
MGQMAQASAEMDEKPKTELRTDSFSPWEIILIAGWFGLLTGLAESVFLIGITQFVLEIGVNLSREALWMAPLTEMVIFLLVGAILALLFKFVPRLFSLRLICFLLALLSSWALFLLLPQLHFLAKSLLALGFSFQFARSASKYQNGFFRLVRITSIGLILIVAGLAVGLLGWGKMAERKALSGLPPASKSAPNVLLITLDTVRARSLSLYGYERQTTPQLERLAKEGAVFDQAIATAPWTLPSHASMFTGKYPDDLSFGWNKPLRTDQSTLAEELGKRGYESAGFVANLIYCSKETGLSRGMIHYEDYPVSLGQMILSSSLGRKITNTGLIRRTIGYNDTLNRKSAEQLNEDFLGWLSSRSGDRPFFAFLNYFDAHEPLLPPAPFDSHFGPIKADEDFYFKDNGLDVKFAEKRKWGEPEIEKYRNAYDNSIAYLDHQIGLLFDELKKRGALDNTVVIITSDHGELLGENGLFGHGNSLYIDSLHVPLLILYPSRVPQGVRIGQPVNLRDLPATILDLIGERDQTAFPGHSLGRFLDKTGETSGSEMMFSELRDTWADGWYPASKGDMESLVTEQYHYIRNGDESEELYDRKNDPKELNNLAQTPEGQKLLEEFRAGLKVITGE